MDRTRLAAIFLILMLLIIVLELFNLQVIQGKKFRGLSDKNCIRLLPQPGARGKIVDRYGRIIAGNKLSYDLMLLPADSRQLSGIITAVSRALGTNPKIIREAFTNNYVAPSVPVPIAKNIDIKKAIHLEELKFDIPGIIIQVNPVRHYPHGKLAAHVLGYLGEIDRWRLTKLADYGYKTKDIVGFGGIEEAYDYYLRQEEGGVSFEVDHRGRLVRLLGFRPPHNGKDIGLTLDLKIQQIVEDKFGERNGCVIIVDPQSAEIIAMASSPGFSPSLFVDKKGGSLSGLFNDPGAPFVNRAISGVYPAGSVFKVVVAAAGLQTGKITPSTTFFCEGSIDIGGQEFDCWSKHGQQDLPAAIAHSCNIFFYKTGLLCGAQSIHDYALKFGLSRPTSIELPYEAGGFVPSPLWRKINKFSRRSGIPLFAGKNWYDGDTLNLSIGQGDLLVTPLQMARMMAVFANGGALISPYIVKEIDARDVSLYRRKSKRLNIDQGIIDSIKKGLRGAVTEEGGTAHILSGLSVSCAGKTGTAQVAGVRSHAWFTGFFPYEKPKYAICVFLEHGGPGFTSCVLAKNIIEAMLEEGLI